jgi:hypothetical protein
LNPTPPENQTGPTQDELLAGCVTFPVQILDRAAFCIRTEEARVHLLPVAEYPKLREVLLDEPRLVELYTGKAKGWGDSLQPDSHERIVTEGRRVNAHFFGQWLPRRKALEEQMQSRVMEGFLAEAARAFAEKLAPPASGNGSTIALPAGERRPVILPGSVLPS